MFINLHFQFLKENLSRSDLYFLAQIFFLYKLNVYKDQVHYICKQTFVICSVYENK